MTSLSDSETPTPAAVPSTFGGRVARTWRSTTVLPVAVALLIVTSVILGGAAVVSRIVSVVSGFLGG
ncbi:hypothetical protein [Litorihabitans aurantiacus]|uniref:Uncharacterized protein n=1 Tax=Litorihabitans aurantiacus TaxID=1930061 RepID=A0AA37XFD9_9MICO|nr:hypothetical protein [Litorihabitans aurantiacus]GMA32398.1 hypothetical protein GCM10025875_23900 [Litorihabitans aurantiacus]